MELLDTIGDHKLPTELKNPFGFNKITRVYVSMQDYWNEGKWTANGTVEFKNGNTKGQQKFDGSSFDDVVLKIKTFIQQLEK